MISAAIRILPSLQPRTNSTDLSYDYIFISTGGCGNNAPVIIDTDGELRWVNPTSIRECLTGFLPFH